MRKCFLSKYQGLMLFVAIVVSTSPAMAETKFVRSQAFDDWMLQCFETGDKKSSKEQCALTQGVGTDAVKLVGSLSVVHDDDKKINLLRLTLPLGISLSDRVKVKGDGALGTMDWVTCVNGGCVASKDIDAALQSKLEAGKGLTLTAKTLKGKRDLILKFSLKGFSKGIKQVH